MIYECRLLYSISVIGTCRSLDRKSIIIKILLQFNGNRFRVYRVLFLPDESQTIII